VARLPSVALFVAFGVLFASTAEAQRAPTRGTGPGQRRTVRPSEIEGEQEKRLPWRNTTFGWTNRVSAQTVGIGADYQSADPYYEWSFSFRPRYYVWTDGDNAASVRLAMSAVTELTNSDTTTERGEFSLDDSTLSFNPAFTLAKDGDYETLLTLAVPRLVLPTSKASRAVGIYAQAGVGAGVEQGFPIREKQKALPTATVGLSTGYGYLFSRANVPEDPDLDLPRTDIAGHPITSDQLAGAALAQHRATAHVHLFLDLWKDVLSFNTEAGVDLFWKYPLDESDVAVANGTAAIPPAENGRFLPASFFSTEFSVTTLSEMLEIGLGYENIASELGTNGQRRSVFYSPDAMFYLSLSLRLDEVYLRANGIQSPEEKPGRGYASR
jgi:hypothetical protein